MADALEATTSPDVLFYHLERAPVEAVLPLLLEKTLERGWRAVVQSGSSERLELLDEALWTYRPESFLPHGTLKDGHSEAQPIFLTTGDDTPNGAAIRFLVDRADPAAYAGFVRMVFLFDGNDSEALSQARAQWKAAKAAGCAATYWQQSEEGRWVKKA
jgi:DNA polymerase III subunit chi